MPIFCRHHYAFRSSNLEENIKMLQILKMGAFLSCVILVPSQVVAGHLHNAAKAGDVQKVKQRVSAGEDVNDTIGQYGRTPLHDAMAKGCIIVSNLLLSKAGGHQCIDNYWRHILAR